MKLAAPTKAPIAEKRPHTEIHHGITRQDEYAWLRDPQWRDVMRDPNALSPDIRAYLEAENLYTEEVLTPLQPLRDTLFQEMKGRIKEEDASVPAKDGPYHYYSRYTLGAQHPLFCRNKTMGAEEILLDGNKEALGESYFKLGDVAHDPTHRWLAWSADRNGSEYFHLRIRDLASGQDLPDEVRDISPGIVWDAIGKSFLYVRVDEKHRPSRVFRHVVGTPSGEDQLIYAEEDAAFYVGLGKTQSGDWLLIDIHDHQTSELHLIPSDRPDAKPLLIAKRQEGIEYDFEHDAPRNRFLILTNRDGAEDFKIMETPVAAPGFEHWRDLISHRTGVLILAHAAFQDFYVRLERENGLSRLIIRHIASGEEHEVAFDEDAYDLSFSSGFEYETTFVRFTYNSMTTPAETYDYDMATRSRVLRKRQEIPSGHKASDYVTRRLFAPATDGELVPVSLLYRIDTPLDGSAPCLLYGYGSYGISIPASFSVTALSLVDRGFIYAIAHIRGGKEKGYRWYADGKVLHKRNTFTDFIAAGEYLAREKFTSRGHIVGHGGSAGGMLMGAVANMAPDLFKGIIAEVPFVDVLATILDASLPLTPPEWNEWGNPIESREAYDYIASYSPYDNVKPQAYPHLFALGGLTDPRVTYWEPAKWVAKLRASKTDKNLTLLRINMDAGHGGASGRFERLKEVALVYAFALAIAERG